MLLKKEGLSDLAADRRIETLARNYGDVDLSDRERAVLDYAAKLTVTPAAMSAGDIARLRAVGLDDRAIHDLCSVTAYYAFVNRIADGLGVELEEGRD